MTASHRTVRANNPAQRRSLHAGGFLLAAIILTGPSTAFAAEGTASVSSEAIFIAELGDTHLAVREWSAANGYRLAGPHWEIYGDPDPVSGHFDVQVLWSLVTL